MRKLSAAVFEVKPIQIYFRADAWKTSPFFNFRLDCHSPAGQWHRSGRICAKQHSITFRAWLSTYWVCPGHLNTDWPQLFAQVQILGQKFHFVPVRKAWVSLWGRQHSSFCTESLDGGLKVKPLPYLNISLHCVRTSHFYASENLLTLISVMLPKQRTATFAARFFGYVVQQSWDISFQ